jgi:hypothetical protein
MFRAHQGETATKQLKTDFFLETTPEIYVLDKGRMEIVDKNRAA